MTVLFAAEAVNHWVYSTVTEPQPLTKWNDNLEQNLESLTVCAWWGKVQLEVNHVQWKP
jgi:hypothetical protein